MTVVADTSPLNYLLLIRQIELLPALFERVLIPGAVRAELTHARAAARVRSWIADPPEWVEVRDSPPIANAALLRLGPGEREAISLARSSGVDTVLLDEAAGRAVAKGLQLEVRGTLGILERGVRLGLCDFDDVLAELAKTSFRMSPAVRAAFVSRASQDLDAI